MFPGLLLPLALLSATSTESDVRSVDCSSPFADRVLCQALEDEANHERYLMMIMGAKIRKG